MSGNGNHGTVNGATLGVDRHGQANRAYSFDGDDDFIAINDSSSLNINDYSSISFWIHTEHFGGRSLATEAIVSKKTSDNSNGFVVYHDWTRRYRLNFRIRGNSGNNEFLTQMER